MPDAGPPPITPNPERGIVVVQQRYEEVVGILKNNRGAEARAMLAMFAGDRKLYDQFLAITFALLAKQSRLLQTASPLSIVQAVKDAASLGLTPLTEDGAIIERSGIAGFQPMYRGILKRVRRSREVASIDAKLIYENDEFDYGDDRGGFWFTHHPFKAQRNPETGNLEGRGGYWGAVAWARMPDGYTYGRVLDETEINYIRDTWGNRISRRGEKLPWETSWGEMALKTVLLRLCKILPAQSVDAILAIEAQNGEAEEIQRLEAKVDSGLDQIQRLALQAVGEETEEVPPGDGDAADLEDPGSADDGGTGALVPKEPEPDEDGGAAVAQPDPLAATTGDPGSDPNVRAAMAAVTRRK